MSIAEMNADLYFSWEPIEKMNVNTQNAEKWMLINGKKGEKTDGLSEDDLFLDHKSWNTWIFYLIIMSVRVYASAKPIKNEPYDKPSQTKFSF